MLPKRGLQRKTNAIALPLKMSYAGLKNR